MRKKRPYIAPDITTMEMERENIMDEPRSFIIIGRDGYYEGGQIVTGNPDDAKETSPFSGDWELW